MQVHFQFLSQALQKVQPVAQSCLAEALAHAQEHCANACSQSSDLGALTELDEASRSWKGAAQVGICGVSLGLRNIGFVLLGKSQLFDIPDNFKCPLFVMRFLELAIFCTHRNSTVMQ